MLRAVKSLSCSLSISRTSSYLQSSAVQRFLCSIRVSEDGRKVHVPSCSDTGYHVLWLRQNCQCGDCLSSTNQKTVTAHNLKGNLKINHATIDDGRLHVEWSSDVDVALNHSGMISLQWLKDNCYSTTTRKKRLKEMEPNYTTELPFMDYSFIMESDEQLWRWLNTINSVGLCGVTGVPTNEEEVSKICSKISRIQETIYGKTFHVRSEPNPINVAYSNEYLGLHMDLACFQSPPGLQALHCIRFDDCVVGGESILLDSLLVVNQFREKYPKHFETLTKIPVTFHKIHYNRDDPIHIVYKRPHIVMDRNDKITKINWAPPTEGALMIPEDELDDYYQAYTLLDTMFNTSEHIINHKLREGEMVIFNNQRILHGRKEFKLNGGIRHFCGCYINIDEFASKFTVLSHQLKKSVPTKHVLNESAYI